MSNQTFYEWITGLTDCDEAIGNLALIIKKDQNFPKDANSRVEIFNYLTKTLGIQENALPTLEDAWKKYSEGK